jgi:hypothetical protein
LEYVERHGDARVPQTHTVDGYRFGVWVNTQRTSYTDGTLDADRQRRLQELPGWTWDSRTDAWEEGFSRLLHYVKDYGDALVPRSHSVDGYNLGAWVKTQRRLHAKGTLEADRQHRLQELPGWTWDPLADRWEEGFRRLLEYVERHGDALVPPSYTIDGYRLGKWVIKQRGYQSKGTLDADRKHRLENLPSWAWDPYADRWEEGFRHLVRYVERHGDALVPASYNIDGYRLGKWVIWQRVNYSKGALRADRERRLKDVTGWTWDPKGDIWEEGFRRLLDYVERHGDARVPQSYTVDGHPLGKWVNNRRVNYAKGTLDADRERRLQALPGWTWKASST